MVMSMNARPTTKERYANAANPHIQALIAGLYRFETHDIALKKMAFIAKQFTTSREEMPDVPKPCLVLWIKDFALTEEEIAANFMGHFAFVTIEAMAEGGFTLSATKLPRALRFHPRRRRVQAAMPNWGHPLLRKVKNGKSFATIEEAHAALEGLHKEYPETTIPAENKLYALIFSRKENPKQPVMRMILEIQNLQGGGFTILPKANSAAPPSGKKPIKNKELQEEKAAVGHFTSLVALKRKRKKK